MFIKTGSVQCNSRILIGLAISHGLRAIVRSSTSMVSVRVTFLGVFSFILVSLLHFGGVFSKAIIPLVS